MRERNNRILRWQLDRLDKIEEEREQAVLAEKRVEKLERSIRILRWRLERRNKILAKIFASKRVDELKENLGRGCIITR